MRLNFKLELRALDSTDCEKIRAWRNDYRIWAWTRQNDLISDAEQLAWFDRQLADPTIRMYGIQMLAGSSRELIGVAGLTSLDFANRRAEVSLYIAPEHQRMGYGKQALTLLLEHGFKNLGLNQIWGETFEGNPAIKLFSDLGFQLDGKRRAFYWKNGRFLDAFLISLLAEEWNARSTARRDVSDLPDRSGDSLPDAKKARRRVRPVDAAEPTAGAAAAPADGAA